MEILERPDHVLPGLRVGRGGERGHRKRGVPPRSSVGVGGSDGPAFHRGLELRRDVNDNVEAGAALKREARQAADGGGRVAGWPARRRKDTGKDDVKKAGNRE